MLQCKNIVNKNNVYKFKNFKKQVSTISEQDTVSAFFFSLEKKFNTWCPKKSLLGFQGSTALWSLAGEEPTEPRNTDQRSKVSDREEVWWTTAETMSFISGSKYANKQTKKDTTLECVGCGVWPPWLLVRVGWCWLEALAAPGQWWALLCCFASLEPVWLDSKQ